MTTQEIVKDFTNYITVEKAMNPGTVRNYQAYVERFFSFVGNKPVEEVTQEDIESFKKHLSTKLKLSHKTINCYLIGIRVFLKYCEKKKIKCMNPYDIEKYSRIKNKEVELLTEDLLEKLLNTELNDTSDLLVNLLFGTGLRIFELHSLRLENVSREKNYITITGKGDKPRIVYLMGNSHKMIIEYMDKTGRNDGPIFLNKQGDPLTIRSMQRIVSDRAKVLLPYGTHLSAHMLRHHFATNLLNKGAKMVTVQKVLGHSSIMTTMRYLHVTDKETREELHDINKVF